MGKSRRAEDATVVLGLGSSPVQVRKMCIRYLEPGDSERMVEVDSTRFVVGNEPSCDLVFSAPTVSRRHFEILQSGDSYAIRDLNSTNGTFVNGTQVKEAFLSPGATLTAGEVEMIFTPVYQISEHKGEKLHSFGSLVAASSSMRSIMGVMQKVARTGTTLLLQGETGVGKSALAKAIHEESPRKHRPFVVFDCASIPPSLIESELFGAEKGAFTGAVVSRAGACEQAQGGTLFLDEIEDLPLELQTKLLRVLEEREVRRLGANKATKLDIHVIAASKRDLILAAQERQFRQDLYYRIAVVCISVPPLRNRKKDIPVLCDYFLKGLHQEDGFGGLAPEIQEQLLSYSWPGNLRELRNILERVECLGPQSAFENMPGKTVLDKNRLTFNVHQPFKEAKEELIDKFEREYIEALLIESDGKVAPAARAAGLNRKYFYDLLKKHRLRG